MYRGLRALGAFSGGPGTFVMPADFILPRGEGGPAIQAWISTLDGLTILQAKHAPHLLWAFQDSIPAWTVLKIHRTVTIVDGCNLAGLRRLLLG